MEYSFGNLDKYLHYEYRDVFYIYRCLIEALIVSVLFMLLPLFIILLTNQLTYENKIPTISPSADSALVSYFKNSLFVTMTYVIFVLSKGFVEGFLYWVVALFSLFGVRIEGSVAGFLQIISNTTNHLRNALVSFLVFLLANRLYERYKPLKSEISIIHFVMTVLLWYGLLSLMLFIEKIFINIVVDELGRGSISGRIFDANYKTFVFKKLAAISQARPHGRSEMKKVIKHMCNDFESNIYLRHNDLDLSSDEAASRLVKSIFWYLDIEFLDFESVKEFFPSNYEEVYNYLNKGSSHGEKAPISFETIRGQAISLRKERDDIMQSLVDRDSILNKLNYILLAGVGFLAMVLFLFLLNVNYKVYLASIGPVIFTFGWIFQGSVVEIYRCFVFLLFSHPFDTGDRVVIDKEELVVRALDLLYTTFEDTNGMKVYIPNVVMFTKKIGNIRRSGLESEEISFEIDGSTNFSQVLDLKRKLQSSLKKSEKDFTGVINIKRYELDNQKVRLVLAVQHVSNFQDPLPRYKRRESFIAKLEKELSSSGISYTHGYTFSP